MKIRDNILKRNKIIEHVKILYEKRGEKAQKENGAVIKGIRNG